MIDEAAQKVTKVRFGELSKNQILLDQITYRSSQSQLRIVNLQMLLTASVPHAWRRIYFGTANDVAHVRFGDWSQKNHRNHSCRGVQLIFISLGKRSVRQNWYELLREKSFAEILEQTVFVVKLDDHAKVQFRELLQANNCFKFFLE